MKQTAVEWLGLQLNMVFTDITEEQWNRAEKLFQQAKEMEKEEPKKKHIVMLIGDKVNEEQTKCYCGHTNYCDCGPEEPKQETPEETYLNELIDEANKEFTLDKKLAKEVAIKFSKWQQERMYSEEEVEIIIQKLMMDVHCGDLCYGDNVIDFKLSPRQWFEQFKKK